jgi:gamma-glutamyl phosphate reductase
VVNGQLIIDNWRMRKQNKKHSRKDPPKNRRASAKTQRNTVIKKAQEQMQKTVPQIAQMNAEDIKAGARENAWLIDNGQLTMCARKNAQKRSRKSHITTEIHIQRLNEVFSSGTE